MHLLSKAIIISAAANFGWIALNVSDSVITHNRQLMMERALLSGTSQQISDNLKMLQEFEAARKNAILSSHDWLVDECWCLQSNPKKLEQQQPTVFI